MDGQWHRLGLDNCLMYISGEDLRYIRLRHDYMEMVRKLLGYSSTEHDPYQTPLVISVPFRDEDGFRVEMNNRNVNISWSEVILHGEIEMNAFLKYAIPRLTEQNESQRPALVWEDDAGVLHTLDGETFKDPTEAIKHGLELMGRKLTIEEQYKIADNLAEVKRGSPGTPSPERKDDVKPSPAEAEKSKGKKRAAPAAPGADEKKPLDAPKRTCGLCKKDISDLPGARYNCDACDDKIHGAFVGGGEECEACKGKGYIFTTSCRASGLEITAVERCDTCEEFESDHIALIKAVREEEKDVIEFLEVGNMLRCSEMPWFRNKEHGGNCERLGDECAGCHAEYIVRFQRERIAHLEAIEEDIDEKGVEDALGPKAKEEGSDKASRPFWSCKCDKSSRHSNLENRCPRCGTLNPNKFKGEKRAAPAARDNTLNCEECGCECPGCIEGASSGDYSKCIGFDKCMDEDEAKDIEGIEVMVHGRPEDQVLTITAAEEAMKNGMKISKEALEELKLKAKDGKVWLPDNAELARFPCGESSCKTGANAAFGCDGCKENKLFTRGQFEIKEEDIKVDRKLARKVTGVLTTNRFWDCECKDDFTKPKAMVRCVKCKAKQEDGPDSKVRELNEFQLIISKEKLQKIDFKEWEEDDLEMFLGEVGMGLVPPFNTTDLISELASYGLDTEKARMTVWKALEEGGVIYGPDAGALRVTMAEQGNYDERALEKKAPEKSACEEKAPEKSACEEKISEKSEPEVRKKVELGLCLDCQRPIDKNKFEGRCGSCDALFKKESAENEKPKKARGPCKDCGTDTDKDELSGRCSPCHILHMEAKESRKKRKMEEMSPKTSRLPKACYVCGHCDADKGICGHPDPFPGVKKVIEGEFCESWDQDNENENSPEEWERINKEKPYRCYCPDCKSTFVDEDECTAASDERSCIEDHGRCTSCQKAWALKPAEEESAKKPHTGICGSCKGTFSADEGEEKDIESIRASGLCLTCYMDLIRKEKEGEEPPKKSARASGAKKEKKKEMKDPAGSKLSKYF